MKKSAGLAHFTRFLLPGLALLVATGNFRAAELKEARVTAIVKDVKLLPGQAEPKPAAVNDTVKGDTAVRTGVDSRSELTFADLTIARLGANTIFSFDKGSRTVELGGGAILLRVPKDSGGARINTAAVTAAITGTTMMAEYHDNDYFKFIMLEGNSRVCQRVQRVDPLAHLKHEKNNPPEQCVDLGPGQMLVGKPGEPLGEPVDVDVRQLVYTSLFTNGFGVIGSEDSIGRTILAQFIAKNEGTLIDTRLIRFDGDPLPNLTDPTSHDVIDQKTAASETPTPTPTPTPVPTPSPTPTPVPTPTPTPTPVPTPTPTPTPVPTPTPTPTPVPTPTPTPTPVPTPTPTPTPVPTPTPTPTPVPTPTPTPTPVPTPTPTPTPQPTPSKFGTPPIITSPDLTTIDSGTTIQTDPSITRNGTTDYGKIYRDQTNDGAPSAYFFTATSAFDTASGFDHLFNGVGGLPIATLKFLSLTLAGDPHISTINGGATNLALISVGNIISPAGAGARTIDANGAVLTFAGIRNLLLGTQNGSIILAPDISFSTLQSMVMHARGSNAVVSLSSNFDVGSLRLNAQTSVQVNGSGFTNEFHSFAGTDFLSGQGKIATGLIDITALHDLNFHSSQFSAGDFSNIAVTLTATNILNIDPASADQSVFTKVRTFQGSGATINLLASTPTVIVFNHNASRVSLSAGTGGIQGTNVGLEGVNVDLFSAGDINLNSANLNNGVAGRGPVPQGSSGIAQVHADGNISIVGELNVLGLVSAGKNVAGTISGGVITAGTISSTDVSALTSINAGSGGIRRFHFFTGSPATGLHLLDAPVVTSSGGINFNGVDGNGSSTAGAPGGQLEIDTNSLSFNASGANITGPVTFNGGQGGGLNQNQQQLGGGNGGFFRVNATNNILVSNDIEATTGLQPQNFSPSGAGGTVNLNSVGGTITVNSRIQVSSNDAAAPSPSPSPAPARRRSAQGGNISLTSARAGTGASPSPRAVAINVNSSAQLLSLLAAAPTPRPGGKITILATGANSDINFNGRAQADGGTIDIRHTGDNGIINITGTTAPGAVAPPPQLSADIIKAGAFGANGQLNIGGNPISADTLIRLYASSSGGLNFIANVTLQSPNIALAAGTISIASGITVTIASINPANIYTNNPNYSTVNGGTNRNAGRFSGPGPLNGVNAPQPYASAPPFDSAPPRPVNGNNGGR